MTNNCSEHHMGYDGVSNLSIKCPSAQAELVQTR